MLVAQEVLATFGCVFTAMAKQSYESPQTAVFGGLVQQSPAVQGSIAHVVLGARASVIVTSLEQSKASQVMDELVSTTQQSLTVH